MKVKLFALSIFMIFSFTQKVQAQVRLNVVLHPVVSLEVFEENIFCEKQNKDLLVHLPLETFIIPSGELLRFELLHLDPYKRYALSHNEQAFKVLTREKSHMIINPKAGIKSHLFKLKITDTSPNSCDEIKANIRLTLEPM